MYFYVFLCMCACVSFYAPCDAGAGGGQRESGPLQLELQKKAVNCLMWVLQSKPGSSAGTVATLTTGPLLQPLIYLKNSHLG